ncbi:GDSL-type esterase/lipase family protein [Zobellia laminariae]|uniref:GDSL-type esterase/lipase family protein n=1 Tax=Zobellia laminariae TaxID=248906 RepID=UPI0026F424D2|nr:GDSL-type esterase/lipase family protein [Zobellia laminariae]WKX75734.1 GDSL-type esterase/lipase family protein [Zobellia laminariae]
MKNTFLAIFFIAFSISNYAQETSTTFNDQEFLAYLENLSENKEAASETKKEFRQKSWAYWSANKIDYNQSPEKYKKALSLYHLNQEKFNNDRVIALDRFKKAIENFKSFDSRNTLPKNPVLFVGSSSIVHWETAKAFPEFPVINRGFGGASIPEIIYYYDDVIKKHTPAILVIYSDIDVEAGKSPSVAVAAYDELLTKVKKDFPETEVLLLAMKPTLIDDFLGKEVAKNKIRTNELLSEYCATEEHMKFVDVSTPMLKPDDAVRSDIFLEDGLHMNPLGYTLWNPILKKEIGELMKTK